MYWNLFVFSTPCLFSLCQVAKANKALHCWNNHKSCTWTTVMKKRQGKFKANLFFQEHFGWRSRPPNAHLWKIRCKCALLSFSFFFFFQLSFVFFLPFSFSKNFLFIFLSLSLFSISFFFHFFPSPSPFSFPVLFSLFFFFLEVEWKSNLCCRQCTHRAQVQKQRKTEYLHCQHDHLII